MATLRPSIEEERRRELVLQTLKDAGIGRYDPEVVDTLTRWIAQVSKGAVQDKRGELSSKGIPADNVSKLILESMGVDSSQINRK
jgi:hypothetical protein